MVLVGAVAIKTLPISQYPQIVPPTVSVSSGYAGASAEVTARVVTTPLEQQINGVEGMLYVNVGCDTAELLSLRHDMNGQG